MNRNIRPNNLLFKFIRLIGKVKSIIRRNRSARYVALFFILLGIWLFVSNLVVCGYIDKRFSTEIKQHSTDLDQSSAAVTHHFDRSMAFLRVIPTIIADDYDVTEAISSFDYQSFKRITPQNRIKFINSQKSLTKLNDHLSRHQQELDVNVIWVLAPNGDCLASSNYDTAESFVGFNYADREYFKSAMQRQQGKQYAVGRQTR